MNIAGLDLVCNNENSASTTATNIPNVDQTALEDVEKEAKELAQSFYQLTNEMKQLLNQISATSVCCTQTYKDSVDKLCTSIDTSVELKNDVLKKAQQLSFNMKPIYELQKKINSIKQILDILETQL